ncbi:alanyl-tRNA editing protein [Paraburkholderia sp. Tr-20389]|uniref:alanyl-tRNA editing protein n=1 Tax=Paraburkholderia sp. Tr-20389 TaxID=2703903 RepID=UPI001F11E41F|nr:alanyl-tRNA editing protein [Paraburkholderia sp. Tr-20389]
MSGQVLSCTRTDDGQYEVVLAATLFHPQGGGQPSDPGTIGDANVLRVSQVDDQVVHMCDREVPVGDARIEVSSAARSLHARLHSAGHLIGFCGEQFGWRAVKGHHWPGEARVVFEPDGDPREMTGDIIEQQVNGHVDAGLSRAVLLDGDKRTVGFGSLPAYSCGGTHVASTADIGKIKISKVKEKKGQVWVYYDLEQ